MEINPVPAYKNLGVWCFLKNLAKLVGFMAIVTLAMSAIGCSPLYEAETTVREAPTTESEIADLRAEIDSLSFQVLVANTEIKDLQAKNLELQGRMVDLDHESFNLLGIADQLAEQQNPYASSVALIGLSFMVNHQCETTQYIKAMPDVDDEYCARWKTFVSGSPWVVIQTDREDELRINYQPSC